jgi:hypothetical protein
VCPLRARRAIKVEEFFPHTQEYMVMKILAIDLGKYKSVACNYVTATGKAKFATIVTHVIELERTARRVPQIAVTAISKRKQCCEFGLERSELRDSFCDLGFVRR